MVHFVVFNFGFIVGGVCFFHSFRSANFTYAMLGGGLVFANLLFWVFLLAG